MPNTKSAKKRVKQSEKKRLINMARKTGIKTAIRKLMDSVERKDSIEETRTFLRNA